MLESFLNRGCLGDVPIDSARSPVIVSYQQIVELAVQADDDPCWGRLANWITRKVKMARRR